MWGILLSPHFVAQVSFAHSTLLRCMGKNSLVKMHLRQSARGMLPISKTVETFALSKRSCCQNCCTDAPKTVSNAKTVALLKLSKLMIVCYICCLCLIPIVRRPHRTPWTALKGSFTWHGNGAGTIHGAGRHPIVLLANWYQTHWQLFLLTVSVSVPAPCRVNALIAISETHFVPQQKCRAVPCRVNVALLGSHYEIIQVQLNALFVSMDL